MIYKSWGTSFSIQCLSQFWKNSINIIIFLICCGAEDPSMAQAQESLPFIACRPQWLGIQPNRLLLVRHSANEAVLGQTEAHLSACLRVEAKVWQRLSGLRLLLSNPSFCSALYPICRTDAAPAADLCSTSLAKKQKKTEKETDRKRSVKVSFRLLHRWINRASERLTPVLFD